jgi:hypothetical protein
MMLSSDGESSLRSFAAKEDSEPLSAIVNFNKFLLAVIASIHAGHVTPCCCRP